MKLTCEQRVAWRLARQHLVERAPSGALLDVTSDLCGLHAQVMSSAELTAWARVEDLAPDAVATALWRDRSLVKLWAMRGTLHLLAAADYPLFQLALSTFGETRAKAWRRILELTQPEVDRVLSAIQDGLTGAEMTREELADAVTRKTRSTALGERVLSGWGGMLKPASFFGDLCFAPNRGRNVCFTNPYTWLGASRLGVSPDEADREVAARFLHTYGPVTRDEYRRWWGSDRTAAQTARFLESIPGVTDVDLEGERAFVIDADLAAIGSVGKPAGVRLLPAFDQYVVTAPRTDGSVFAVEQRDRIYRTAGWLSPVLLLAGRIAGVWSHAKKGKRVVVAIEPFAPVKPKVRKAAGDEAERLAAFLGGTLQLAWA